MILAPKNQINSFSHISHLLTSSMMLVFDIKLNYSNIYLNLDHRFFDGLSHFLLKTTMI